MRATAEMPQPAAEYAVDLLTGAADVLAQNLYPHSNKVDGLDRGHDKLSEDCDMQVTSR